MFPSDRCSPCSTLSESIYLSCERRFRLGINTPSYNFFGHAKIFNAFIAEQRFVHVAYCTSGCNYICNLTCHGTWLKLASQFVTNFGDAGLLAIVQISNRQFCTIKLCLWQAVRKWTISKHIPLVRLPLLTLVTLKGHVKFKKIYI